MLPYNVSKICALCWSHNMTFAWADSHSCLIPYGACSQLVFLQSFYVVIDALCTLQYSVHSYLYFQTENIVSFVLRWSSVVQFWRISWSTLLWLQWSDQRMKRKPRRAASYYGNTSPVSSSSLCCSSSPASLTWCSHSMTRSDKVML